MLLSKDAHMAFVDRYPEREAFNIGIFCLHRWAKEDGSAFWASVQRCFYILDALQNWGFRRVLPEIRQLRRQAYKHGFPRELIPETIRRGFFYDQYKRQTKGKE